MIVLPAGNPSEWTGPTGNNTYLLPGQVPTLIDAGVGRSAHVEAIAHALEGRPLSLLLITHGHVDHIAGVPILVARWPRLIVRRLRVGDAPITDGERIHAGDRTLRAVATPGHAPDHCCFFDETTRDLYSGDLLRLGGTVVIPASRGGDLASYLESLARVRTLSPERLLPGHGPVIDQPLPLIAEYERHRAERDAQVIDALDNGCRTPEEIVARIYAGLASGLMAAAAETVTAHLVKLKGEGRATEAAGDWQRPVS